ncbi:hypothetical protein [Paenibacillus mesophilus]|uniref:hypothetical protein n=1 Tax=Paenibacillus mesophilus TaxID=2582849 RepID=UPI001EE48DD4|nr:hypothetical protein [Paenibacillus mesophilus]
MQKRPSSVFAQVYAAYWIENVEPAAGGGTALALGEQGPGFTIRPDGSSEQMTQWTGIHIIHVAHAQ